MSGESSSSETWQAPEYHALLHRAQQELAQFNDREALESFEAALRLNPAATAARLGRIEALLRLDECERALAASNPDSPLPEELALRAEALAVLRRHDEALQSAARALRLSPRDARTLSAYGLAEVLAGYAGNGLKSFEQALTMDPAYARAHAGRALALAALSRGNEAISAYRQAAGLTPNDPKVFLQAGILMLRLGYLDNALAAFKAALALRPNNVAALDGCIQALRSLSRYEEADGYYERLLRLQPTMDYQLGERFSCRLQCCDWRDYEAHGASIMAGLQRGERTCLPFALFAHNDSAAEQRRCAEIYAADRCTAKRPLAPRGPVEHPRLRIGYLSADFKNHPVGQLMAGVLAAHDRSHFEVFAFSACPDDGGEPRRRIAAGVEHFENVESLQDAAIAARMRELEIDIAVDLGGHTQGSRTRALAYRPAPVQIGLLGYPGTTGASFMDYLVADRQVIPEQDRQSFTEQIIYLPMSYIPGDLATEAGSLPARTDIGLPETGPVFCSFNAPYKLNPAMFDTWMRILRAVPESVLWLRNASGAVLRNLGREASARGIDPKRLRYASHTSGLSDYYARLSLADLFLDTYPYNAHSTACDALRAGVPVLTLRGHSFPSRVATSLLHAVGMPELSVNSPAAYEALAVDLAKDPARLGVLKLKLAAAVSSSPLSDPLGYCRNLETAYRAVWSRNQRGEGPMSLEVGTGRQS